METITLSNNETQSDQQLHVAAAAGGLDGGEHSPVEDEQMMNLSDMAELTQEMQEDIVAIPKEVILISLVSQEQALYNPKHENYRNTQRKDIKWMEIATNVGWTEMQCKAKWKAMRDQYCRELKRSKFNVKANVKWKYFKELDFLRPYALSRNYRPRNSTLHNSSNNNNNVTNNNLLGTQDNNNDPNNPKYSATIKIENNPPQVTTTFSSCDFTTTSQPDSKTDNTITTTTTTLTEEQLNSVMQQQQELQQHQHTDDGSWSYITGRTVAASNVPRPSNSDTADGLHEATLLPSHAQQQTDEALYNAFVDCVGQIQQQQQQQQQQQLCQQQTQQSQHTEEEDDDPIHTFLNIESYFEKELIALIQHEDILYNSFHPNYRNVKMKLEVWDEIARKLKKTVKQCRLKWKALRDQFIREHKRLKHRENIETLPRWKHYDALSFLQKFIKHKPCDYEAKNMLQIPKTELDTDMDDEEEQINISSSSPLHSPIEAIKCELQQQQLELQDLSVLTDPQQSHQQQQHHHHHHSNQEQSQADNICVGSGSVSGYDEMDIDNYMIGDSTSVDDGHDDVANDDTDDVKADDDRKSQQSFSAYTAAHNTSVSNELSNQVVDAPTQAFKEIKDSTSPTHQQHQPAPTPTQLQQQHEHINMPPLDMADATSLVASETLAGSSSSTASNSLLLNAGASSSNSSNHSSSNGITITSAVATLDVNTVPSPPPAAAATPATAAAASGSFTNGDDDEVGAFFKAVAMKIRNAKMSAVAFTDLQIDILRVINGSLRNH